MPRNVEIKARIGDLETLARRAAALADQGSVEIVQDDTFFPCPNGRLKLRTFADGVGELILYQRADEAGPKESRFERVPVPDAAALRELLARAYGTAGRVRKERTLYLAGRTRLHLDRVEGLGDFLELEVVLAEGEPVAAGVAEARALLGRLGISDTQLVEGSYRDLLAAEELPRA